MDTWRAWEFLYGRTGNDTWENTLKTSNVVMECSFGKMDRSMRERGHRGSNMERESTPISTERSRMGLGKMERESVAIAFNLTNGLY
jgi:hypothetical protein